MAKRRRQTEHPEVLEMMDLWVSKALGDRILLTGKILHQKWNKFADLVGVPEDERLKLSNGWLAHFKERHSLQEMRRYGEAASANAETVAIRKTYILLYCTLLCFFMLFHAFSCFSVKAREKYNKSNPPYFSECLGIWLKK